jgi:hypothetical protein
MVLSSGVGLNRIVAMKKKPQQAGNEGIYTSTYLNEIKFGQATDRIPHEVIAHLKGH